ncbi:MAG: response regulator transcription factor [Candidatus Humimicrobiaceae bacterium]
MSKIYIIDDDRDIVESISIILKTNGYEISAQYNDENVVENVLKYNPDLIILDVIFPENSAAGFEIARELKRESKSENIPIIMLSAVNERGSYPGRFSTEDADNEWLPINLYIDKPVQPGELLEKVKSVLEK